MSRHDNECWDCGQIRPDTKPTPGDYHAHVQHMRIQSEVATQIRDAALSVWRNFAIYSDKKWPADTVDAFRNLFKWVAPDYLPEFESEVMLDAEYHKRKAGG